MKKNSLKILACILFFAMVIGLTACSNRSGNSSAATSPDQVKSKSSESTIPAPKTQTYFYNAKSFSDDVAWVQRDSSHWECIDDKGKTLFSLGADSVPLSDFTDGGSIIETTDSKNIKVKKIVDKSGTVVFPKNDGYQYNFIISFGNCNFVVRNINTFEKTENQTGIVDNTGKWILEPTPDLTADFPGDYISSPLEPNGGFLFVSYHGNNLYDAHSNEFFISNANTGDKYLELMRRALEYFYSEDLFFLTTYTNDMMHPTHKVSLHIPYTYGMTYAEFDLAKLGFNDVGTGFYDRNHNMVIDLSSYKDAEAVGGFSGGYCSVRLTNPQNSSFGTVIDKKGNRMFEPISQQLGKVSCGRILVQSKDEGKEYYIDVNGKTVIPNITNGTNFSENGLANIGSSNAGSKGVYYIDTDGNIAF